MTVAPAPAPDDAMSYALRYAAQGWRVFPCRPGDKRPATTNGLLDGSVEPDRIRSWWAKNPTYNIGIVTGPTSGIWVLDPDVDTFEGKHGDEELRALIDQHGPLPDTLTSLTPRGGQHLFFRWNDAYDIRNDQSGQIGKDIDVRGDGGYVVVAPSLRRWQQDDGYYQLYPEGKAYEWDEGQPPEPADAPEWLLRLVSHKERPKAPAAATPPRDVGDRPGDLWAAQTSWRQILEPDGWTLSHVSSDGEHHWVRPGKEVREGTSATTGYTANDNLKVFTSSLAHMGLHAEETYSKLGYLAATRHNGDYSAAASALAAKGHRVDPLDGWGDVLPSSSTHPGADDGGWLPLRPLEAERNLPPWPIHVLPDWMADHIIESADQLQVPPDLCAQFALGAVAAVAMGHSKVVVGGKWREPLNLYLVTALPSGGGKSPAEKLMTAPVREWERRRHEASQAEVSESQTRRRVLEGLAKAAEQSAARKSEPMSVAIDARLELDAHKVIYPFRRLADDATPEKLTQILAEQGGLMAILSTEAALMDMVAGGYSSAPNINVYLKAFSGDTIMVDRKGSANTGPTELRIEEPLLTVGLAMQPHVIDFVGTQNKQLEGRGFLARFLYSFPTPTTGRRDRSRVLEVQSTAAADRYNAMMTSLAEAWSTPTVDMLLTADAALRFVGWLQDQEAKMCGEYAPISAWLAKLQSSTLRVAGILHLCHGNAATTPIDIATVEAALEAAEYWTAHALSQAVGIGESKAVDDAKAMVATMARKGVAGGAPRDLWLLMRPRFKGVEDMVEGLMHLEACGYLRRTEGEWFDVGVQRKTVHFEVREWNDIKEHEDAAERRLTRETTGSPKGKSSESLTLSPIYSPPLVVTRVNDPAELSTGDDPDELEELDFI